MTPEAERSVESERQASSSPEQLGPLRTVLRELEAAMRAPGSALEPVADDLRELGDRLDQGRLHLAVAGQFKRGKSTLLNALLGEDILPVGVVPVTAVPTFVHFGEDRSVRVVYGDDRPDDAWSVADPSEVQSLLRRYVGEQENPRNRLGVRRVVVSLPGAILERGVVLIDMPGIGSTNLHNTETATATLAECDAALFLVSADPPITQVELEFLRQVRQRVPRVFYLFNKTDYLDTEERSAAIGFLRRTLTESEVEADAQVFPLSARRGLAARRTQDSAAWRDSGLAAIESHLIGFLEREKRATLQSAVALRAGELAQNALLELRLQVGSLELPEAELAKRLEILDGKLAEAWRARELAVDLLNADERRLAAALERQAETLRDRGREEFARLLSLSPPPGDVAASVSDQVSEAIPRFFEEHLQSVRRSFEEELNTVLGRHEKQAETLIESVYRTAAELFDVPYRPPRHDLNLEVRHAPYWVTEKWVSTLHVLPAGAFERFLPRRTRQRRLRRRLAGDIEALVARNVENLRWATLQNLKLTVRRFERRVRERLQFAVSLIEGAVETVSELRLGTERETAGELDRLRRTIRRLEALSAELPENEAF